MTVDRIYDSVVDEKLEEIGEVVSPRDIKLQRIKVSI